MWVSRKEYVFFNLARRVRKSRAQKIAPEPERSSVRGKHRRGGWGPPGSRMLPPQAGKSEFGKDEELGGVKP